MIAPVIHYLVEALRNCSQMSHLPTGTLLVSLMVLAAAVLALALLRTRARR